MALNSTERSTLLWSFWKIATQTRKSWAARMIQALKACVWMSEVPGCGKTEFTRKQEEEDCQKMQFLTIGNKDMEQFRSMENEGKMEPDF